MHARRRLAPLVLALAAGCGGSNAAPRSTPEPAMNDIARPTPPIAEKRNHEVVSPNGTRVDEYYWLRDDTRKDPDVLGYLEAENAYARAVLEPTRALQETLYQEIIGRIKEDDSTAPVLDDGYWYYTRYETGKEYPIRARRKGTLEAPEEILIDGNERATGHDFYSLGGLSVSDDGALAAFSEDTIGRRQYTLRIVELGTGKVLDDEVVNITGSVMWAADNRTVVYVEKDPVTLRGYRVKAHVVGTPSADDRLLYQEDDETFYTGIWRSKSDDYLFITLWSTLTSEVRYARADDAALAFQPVIPRTRGHEYSVEHRGDSFIIRTNADGATNFKLVQAPIARAADRSTWREIMPHSDEVFIHDFDVFRDFLAVSERSNALRRIRIRRWADGVESFIGADEPTYTMGLGSTPEFDSKTVRYAYTSLTTPASDYDYVVATGERILRKRQPVLGPFDPADYQSELLWVPARDGEKIPVSVVYRKDTPIDGTAPLHQYGYGSYGSSSDPYFSHSRLSLLDRGFVFAIAHVRGGQERGRRWYENGRQLHKMNTFTDFIDVTEYLVARGYGARDKVFAGGGSAGGLLMGAVANLRPDLYRGVLAWVPFVDVVTTMLDEDIPLTTGEFDEWGNPKQKAFYDYMLSYSPYDNVGNKDYPAMLVVTGLWDSQVQYWEPAKWVARLRDRGTGDNPILLVTEMEAGHGGKSGRYEKFREVARDYAFLVWLATAEAPASVPVQR